MPIVRVVMLSKALIVGSYQRKAEILAAHSDIDLTVAVPPEWRDGALVRRLERAHERGYRLVETPIVRSGDFHLHFYPRFGAVLDAARPDVVHVDEEPYNLATFLALVAARRRGAKTVFFTWQNLRRRYPLPFSWFERYAYRHVAGAIVGSHTAGGVLRAKGYSGPMWRIPQVGVDADVFRPAEGPTAPRPFTAGYAGRLIAAKGVDLLLDAMAGLPGPWRLVILGDGEARRDLERRATVLSIADRVTFTPWMPSDRLQAFYPTLDALVLPSRSTPTWVEQFGRVLTEAMACGVPCVGSDSGEIPYVLTDAGLVFAEGDVGALRAHLSRLATSPPLRAALGLAGRERVMTRFTMTRVANETAEVYRKVARA